MRSRKTLFFSAFEYRTALREWVEARKELDRTLSFQAVAEASRVQKSYLSRVFKLDAHLSADQLYRACQYLEMGDDERSFLLLLLEWQRSEIPERREELAAQLDLIRGRKLATPEYISNEPVQAAGATGEFFEDPWLAIVYRSLFVEEFSRKPTTLTSVLKISPTKLARVLDRLETLGAIRRRNSGWAPIENKLHLNPDHALYPLWRNELRLLSSVRQSTHPDEKKNYGFSAICVGSPEVRTAIRAKFLQFLAEIEPLLTQAPNHEVFQIDFDLVSWSGD